MRRLALSVVLALSGLLPALAQQRPEALQVRELRLKNGLTVWLNEDHSQPKVYGELVVKAGAKDCPDTGIAHYLEHVLFKGTQRLGTTDYEQERPWLDSIAARYDELAAATDDARRLEIQQEISRLSQHAAQYAIPNEFDRLTSRYGGTALNASTSYDVTEFHNTFAPQYLEQWCWLNSERMLNPVFRLFQGELETVYEEKNRASDNIGTAAVERVMRKAFEGHPYQYPIIGSTENLKNPRLSEMEAFFRRYYVAGNMGLMLSGDFSAEGLEPLLERTFGRLPAGEAPRAAMPALQPLRGETLSLKVNIPLVKAVGLLFRGPLQQEADFRALQLAMRLLTNDNETGLLDSLRTAHKVMFAVGENFAMNEAGAVGLLVIPKLPFGSKKKAERLCWQQIERVRQGDFTDERLEELKLGLLRDVEDALETITERAQTMGEVFAQGRSWADYLAEAEAIRAVGKADVVAAARRYLLSDQYLRGVKKFGSYPKEKVSQPGYKAVVPPHAREQSQLARELEQLPVAERAPRLLNLDNDVETCAISPAYSLYRVANPLNDVFTLSLKWHGGTRNDPRLELLDDIFSELGTDSLGKHLLGEAWQRLGTTVETHASDNYFMLTLRGFESQLQPSLRLLGHVLTHLQPDREAQRELQKEYAMSRRQLVRENQQVFSLVLDFLTKGARSQYLLAPTPAEVKKMRADDVLRLLDDVRQYPCDVLYCGRQTAADVADLCRRYLPAATGSKPTPDNAIRLQEYGEPAVYVYDMPDARQTYVGAYGSVKPGLTDREEAQLRLWAQYMGGGMSSLLFQEIREFRSMAYATGGQDITPNRALHADHPSGYLAYLGTQADKTMQALAVLDSLLGQMPVNELNVASARQEVINNINNNYPSHRQLAHFVSSYRMAGYKDDPHASLVRLVPTLTTQDMLDFYEQNIRRQPRIYFIIGPRKQLDMARLSRYGRVVELKKDDLLR